MLRELIPLWPKYLLSIFSLLKLLKNIVFAVTNSLAIQVSEDNRSRHCERNIHKLIMFKLNFNQKLKAFLLLQTFPCNFDSIRFDLSFSISLFLFARTFWTEEVGYSLSVTFYGLRHSKPHWLIYGGFSIAKGSNICSILSLINIFHFLSFLFFRSM